MSKAPLTANQRLIIVRSFIAVMAVNAVYGSGKICNTAGKEIAAFKVWDCLLTQMFGKKGIFETITEFQGGEFTLEKIRFRSRKEL